MLNLNKITGNKARRQEIKLFAEINYKSVPHIPLKPFTETQLTEEQSTQSLIPCFGRKVSRELLINAEAFLHSILGFQNNFRNYLQNL